MNPTGGNSAPDYPYYITTEPMIVKKLAIPAGTKLVYEEQFMKSGRQHNILSESKLNDIEFENGITVEWGGVPITRINKFFNSEMRGFTVYADFEKLEEGKKSRFAKIWQSCSNDIGVMVRNIDDWSFNTKNISDVDDCSVLYQRYFKDNREQQDFLDNMYKELLKVQSK